ncbi:NAD-dependent epimerase/dehydratase family protein [Embleya sp. MST-111070]|uniref:NAD-dependent epimerase/dehydratase family protein n=1 Tax=Embleya sp. MST-111070 TaxID=3398231 RepID=UPI003F73A75C
MNTRILVTGAAGYVGSLVVDALAARVGSGAMRCLVRRPAQADALRARGLEVHMGDLTDARGAEPLVDGCAVVVHAAAQLGSVSRQRAFEVNVDATADLARAAVNARAERFVFLSSIEAYGLFDGRVLDEEQPHRPGGHVYGESKAAAERVLRGICPAGRGTALTILRPGMVYGPRSPYWTGRYRDRALRGPIRVLGPGGRVFPVFEADVVAAVLRACTGTPVPGVFNLVADEGLTWWDWARAHHALAGRGRARRESVALLRARSAARRLAGRPGHGRRLEVETRTGSIPHDRAACALGWHPTSFVDGMAACASAEATSGRRS